MAVRVKLEIKVGNKKERAVALANAGYESTGPEVLVPARFAKEKLKLKCIGTKEVYTTAGRKKLELIALGTVSVRVVTQDRNSKWVKSMLLISKTEDQVVINDVLIGELGIVLVNTKEGQWRFIDDGQEIVGGGIAGMQAALDLAESGIKVYLIDSKPGIGGVMSMLDKTFPTNDCAMCTMAPRLVAIGRHKDIELITMADIEKIEGEAGNLKITLNKRARYVDESKCTGCGTCVSNSPTRN